MGHDWIIDVLADLKTFARKNELPLLAAQLDETALIAFAEIDGKIEHSSCMKRGDGIGARQVFSGVGAGGSA